MGKRRHRGKGVSPHRVTSIMTTSKNGGKVLNLKSTMFIVNFEKHPGFLLISQPAITFSKLTIETVEQCVKYVQS